MELVECWGISPLVEEIKEGCHIECCTVLYQSPGLVLIKLEQRNKQGGLLMDQLATMNSTMKAMMATMPKGCLHKNTHRAERGADSGKE